MKIFFNQETMNVDSSLERNRYALDRIADGLRRPGADSSYLLQRILVVGGSSPDGSAEFNRKLSEERANAVTDYLSRYIALPDSLKAIDFLGRDWNGLVRLVEDDPEVPYKEEALALLRQIVEEVQGNTPAKGDPLRRLKKLRYGVPYYYMYLHLFPELRASQLFMWYSQPETPQPDVMSVQPDTATVEAERPIELPALSTLPDVQETQEVQATSEAPAQPTQKPFYMDIRTNLLYDALAVPNIGVEFYLGNRWSVAGNWMYAWWKTDRRHRYWRIYGGDLALRRWFGKAAQRKPLTGHHLGLYGQVLIYDFEWGGRGYMAGEPGGNILDRANYAFGLEYGYSLPLARQLNLDFTLGLGYMGGTYYEYLPANGTYVWQATKDRHYVGPTKLEVSLVWLIGNGNCNKKGGKQ
ncbi:MAG: DUF3575 domain-containing protein [Bacteroides sp.]|nr:DUF3575 domain-containing protein [Bacteroides sp.]